MMDERRRVWIMIGISAVVLLTAALLVIVLEGFNAWSLLSLLIIVPSRTFGAASRSRTRGHGT
jgi:hypothetical protein